jgi:hypothetical protein
MQGRKLNEEIELWRMQEQPQATRELRAAEGFRGRAFVASASVAGVFLVGRCQTSVARLSGSE